MFKSSLTVFICSVFTLFAFLLVAFVLLFATFVFLSPIHTENPPIMKAIVGVVVFYALASAPLALVLYFLRGKSLSIVPFALFAMLMVWTMAFCQSYVPIKDEIYTFLIWNTSLLTLLLSFIISAVCVVRNKIYWFPMALLYSLPIILILLIKVMDPNFFWFLIPVGVLFAFNAVIEYGRHKGHHGASGIPVFGGLIAAMGAFMCLPYWWALCAPLFLWFDFGMIMLAVLYVFPKHFPEFHQEEQTSPNTQVPDCDVIPLSFKDKISFAARALLWSTVVLFFVAGSINNKIKRDDRKYNKYKESVNALTHEVRRHENPLDFRLQF